MCEASPGARCSEKCERALVAARTAYDSEYPDGPPINPLTSARASQVCDAGTEIRLATQSDGSVSIDELEFLGGTEFWLPGPTLTADAAADLGAWLVDPWAHTSSRCGHNRKFDPTWGDDELAIVCRNGVYSASMTDGREARPIAEFSASQAALMGEWLLKRTPSPN